jgi:Toastrack DUF4097
MKRGMKWILTTVSIGLTALFLATSAQGAEATFARDLTVHGRAQLIVANGSGTIHLTESADGHVRIQGRVRSNWGGSDTDVNQIAAHPPIQQTGNIVRVGERHEHLRNISIDYEIEAPANSYLEAATGSGSIRDDGVGSGTRLNTGSGSIHATGLKDWYSVSTGSGSIYAEGSGNGDVTASTGSGTIELHGLHGALRATTGSGSIKADGVPQGPWHLDTGSGGVELQTGSAAFTLDASTGSGGIRCEREMTGLTNTGKHHLSGQIQGGGPLVRIKTGSGSIRID